MQCCIIIINSVSDVWWMDAHTYTSTYTSVGTYVYKHICTSVCMQQLLAVGNNYII